MMNQNSAISGLRQQERPLNGRYRPRRTMKYFKCNCNPNSLLPVMPNKVTQANALSHTSVGNVDDDAADSSVVCQQNTPSTNNLRKFSHTTKNVIISPDDHTTSPDLSVLHSKSSFLSSVASYYLRIAVENCLWLMSWLSSSSRSIIWRLQRCSTKSIVYFYWMRCILIFLMLITSSAHEVILQHLQGNENALHTLRNNHSSASMPIRPYVTQELTTSSSDRLEHDFYSTSLTIPASPNSVSNARMSNLLRREHILLRQHQPKDVNRQHQAEKPNSVNLNSSSRFSSTCATCHARAKAKIDSLESIKLHILSRLKLPPLNEERPKRRDVPQNILDNYYSKYDHNGQRRDYKKKPSYKHSIVNENSEEMDEAKQEKHDYDEQMQSDDPGAYSLEDYEDVDEEDQLYTHINSIYVFPSTSKLRHNRRNEFLTFKLDGSEQTTITGAVLHLYIRGEEWIKNFHSDIFNQIAANGTHSEVVLNVHRALRRNNSFNYTHTMQVIQIRHRIPVGLGQWIEVELKDLQQLRIDKEPDNNLIIFVRPKDEWMRHVVETGKSNSKGADSALAAHIEVRTQSGLGRQKRSTSLDCQESDNELRCCRYPLKVNFTSFGWSFVVAPIDFDAYFCNGECKLGFLPEHPHTHLAALTRSASPCCSPTKMSSLTLLYFNFEQHLVLSTIPNMTVEKCSCS